jgi:hypothetical protein
MGTRPDTPGLVSGKERGDHGGLSIFVVIITFAVIIFMGAIVDFEQKLEVRHDVNIIAQEAARAGAGQIDRGHAYTSGQYIVDRDAAIRASNNYLRASGYSGSVTPVGTRSIQVRVIAERQAIFLPLIGISTLRAEGAATADLVTGVTQEGR